MKLSQQVKPISYLKAHTAEVFRQIREHHEPYIITQNGEATGVLQDIESYEQMQESIALLKILALGNRQIEEGRTSTAAEVFAQLRKRRKKS